jgi:RNA polymerase-binding transcription factor DksA
MAEEKTRYSEAELKEFEALINKKLEDARVDYNLLKNSLSHSDNHGTDDTGRTFNMMEDGSDTLSREEVAQLAARQEKFIQNLQAALVRIQNKTYGVCRVSGNLIPKERLRLVPHATTTIDAKNAQNKP